MFKNILIILGLAIPGHSLFAGTSADYDSYAGRDYQTDSSRSGSLDGGSSDTNYQQLSPDTHNYSTSGTGSGSDSSPGTQTQASDPLSDGSSQMDQYRAQMEQQQTAQQPSASNDDSAPNNTVSSTGTSSGAPQFNPDHCTMDVDPISKKQLDSYTCNVGGSVTQTTSSASAKIVSGSTFYKTEVVAGNGGSVEAASFKSSLASNAGFTGQHAVAHSGATSVGYRCGDGSFEAVGSAGFDQSQYCTSASGVQRVEYRPENMNSSFIENKVQNNRAKVYGHNGNAGLLAEQKAIIKRAYDDSASNTVTVSSQGNVQTSVTGTNVQTSDGSTGQNSNYYQLGDNYHNYQSSQTR